MSTPELAEHRRLLDGWRRASGVPSARGGVVHERSPDGTESRIVYSSLEAAEADEVISAEIAAADAGSYTLEWKVYGHDTPADLPERLRAAEFEAEDPESVLVLPLTETRVNAFGPSGHEIRRVQDVAGLEDVAALARAAGRANADEEKEQYALVLRDAPETVAIFVAYAGDEPVASSRTHYSADGTIAEIAGSRTSPTHRRRGLFTALLGEQLRDAWASGRRHAFTDALPTSEPIFSRHGFARITTTQPFLYVPRPKDRNAPHDHDLAQQQVDPALPRGRRSPDSTGVLPARGRVG